MDHGIKGLLVTVYFVSSNLLHKHHFGALCSFVLPFMYLLHRRYIPFVHIDSLYFVHTINK